MASETQAPRWNLSKAYYGEKGQDAATAIKDPQINTDLEQASELANAFEERYKDKDVIRHLDGDALAAVISEYEVIDEILAKVQFFAHLSRVTHLDNEDVTEAVSSINSTVSATSGKLVFFSSELAKVDDIEDKLASSESLEVYQPWLNKQLSFKPYQLDAAREQELHDTAHDRREKWIEQYDTINASLRVPMPNRLLMDADREQYSVTGDDGTTELTIVDLTKYALDTNPERREVAFRLRCAAFSEKSDDFVEIANILAKDKAVIDRERGYTSPMQSKYLENEVEEEVVTSLVSTVRNGYSDTMHRYYALKATELGKDKLDLWDLSAPWPTKSEKKITWDEAKTIILEAFRDFSPEMADIAQKFFDEGWIDAEPRAGKRGGGFCEGPDRGGHPVILMNWQGNNNSLKTLAHELGHGINMYLAKSHTHLLSDVDKAPVTTAEVPSTFAEELVFQAMLNKVDSDEEKILLLSKKIEDSLGTVARQCSFHSFEEKMHGAAKDGRELDRETLAKFWIDSLDESLGPAVNTRTEEAYQDEWARIRHFMHYDFYVHSYSFADLMSKSIANTSNDVTDFPEKVLGLYKDLTVKHHSELTAPFDLDARDASFWQGGMDVIKGYIDELDRLLVDKQQLPDTEFSANAPQGTIKPDQNTPAARNGRREYTGR